MFDVIAVSRHIVAKSSGSVKLVFLLELITTAAGLNITYLQDKASLVF